MISVCWGWEGCFLGNFSANNRFRWARTSRGTKEPENLFFPFWWLLKREVYCLNFNGIFLVLPRMWTLSWRGLYSKSGNSGWFFVLRVLWGGESNANRLFLAFQSFELYSGLCHGLLGFCLISPPSMVLVGSIWFRTFHIFIFLTWKDGWPLGLQAFKWKTDIQRSFFIFLSCRALGFKFLFDLFWENN